MNNRVIVLEGPDCGGKSTLAESLAKDHGFKIVHTSKPRDNENVFEHYTGALMSALCSDQPTVFDRLHLGENIYGPIMRDRDLLTEQGTVLINRIMRARDVKFVICRPYEITFRQNFLDRGDSYVQRLDVAMKIYKQYDTYANLNADLVSVYNYDVCSLYDQIDALFTPDRTLPRGCTGSPLAQWLIVGDQVNHKILEHDLPFHYLGNSSAWLFRALQQTKKQEKDLAFTNAHTIGGSPRDLLPVTERMPNFKRAIALGRKAEKACINSGIPYVYVEHPSCHKRFKHYELSDYVKQLKGAMR